MKYMPTFNDGLTKDQRYYMRHKEQRSQYQKLYNKKYSIKNQGNKERWKKYNQTRDQDKQKKWQQEHFVQGKYNEYHKNWRENNKFLSKFYSHKRRIKLQNLTTKTIQQVYEDNIKKFGTLTCYLCLKPIEFGQDHLEHKIPLSRGGNNLYENLAVSCKNCNIKKGRKTEKEYLLVA